MSENDVVKMCEQLRTSWPEKVEVQWGDDSGQYVNMLVESSSPHETRARIRQVYLDGELRSSELSHASIIVVTGTNGWNDYLLLHHFEETEELDRLDDA